jgi:hypothetical protein
MEPEGSQLPATCLYPEAAQSTYSNSKIIQRIFIKFHIEEIN